MKKTKGYHVSILLNEVLEIAPKEGILVDITLGGGGHSKKLFENLTKGKLISFDRDEDAINFVAKENNLEKKEKYFEKIENEKSWIVIKSEFSDIKSKLGNLGFEKVDFILADLGVSSYQIDEDKRGFSFLQNGPLDMRMDKNQILTAKDLINGLKASELEKIFSRYGEEKYSKKIAENIVKARSKKELKTTFDIVEIIRNSVGSFYEQDKHPARRVFQALRIAVNNELGELESLCNYIPEIIKDNGIVVILTFHSLERNILESKFQIIEKIYPSDEEIKQNSRSKSCIGYIIKLPK